MRMGWWRIGAVEPARRALDSLRLGWRRIRAGRCGDGGTSTGSG